MSERYGECRLWFPDGYVSAMSGLKNATQIVPWLESEEGLRFRMQELSKRITKTKESHP